MAVRNVPLDRLKLDFNLYPRRHVNSTRERNYALAMEAGAAFPPILVEEGSYRVLDGFHRFGAAKRRGLKSIKAKIVKTRDEAHARLLATEANREHGEPLSQSDRTHTILLLQEVGVEPPEIAVALGTTEQNVVELALRITVDTNGTARVAKQPLWPKKGEAPRVLTPEQVQVAESMPAWHHLQRVRQLTKELKAGLVDLEDDRLSKALGELRDAIDVAL